MKKLRKQAKELLQTTGKIYHYRRDLITEGRLEELNHAVGELQTLMRRPEPEPLQDAITHLDALLREIGGKMYPKTFWNDNIEVILVAAIIVIGIRTFFFQPFIIPTNSMYPTYSGMDTVLYESDEDEPHKAEPNRLTKLIRFATLGARHKSLIAKNSGQVQLLARITKEGAQPYVEKVKGRKFFILPTVRARYTFLVDGQPHQITLPADLDMRGPLTQTFDFSQAKLRANDDGKTVYAFNKTVQAGEDILRFDITLGDALFVDRISYHFRKPRVGDPFVFRTDDIQQEIGRWSKDYTNKYYIKRIGGAAGDTLEIRDGALYADGQPRDEAKAFGRNARREGEYGGYLNQNLLDEGRQLPVPEKSYVALGDNSANSLDSRTWGFVPEKAVIGKAIFIYYPFTKRWGLAE